MKVLLFLSFLLVSSMATIVRTPLTGGLNTGSYYNVLNIGTPSKVYYVVADTGSSTLILTTNACSACTPYANNIYSIAGSSSSSRVSCSSSKCQPNKCTSSCPGSCSSSRACCANNSYNQCGFYTAYGDGTRTTGGLVFDIISAVNVEGGRVYNVSTTFGGIEYMTGLLDNTDGILGLAYKSLACSPSCINTFYDDMIEQHSGFKNEFTMCFGSKEGILAYGGADTGLYKGNLTWIDIDSDGFYSISLNDIRVNGKSVVRTKSYSAIVDSGTTLLALQSSLYESLKQYFQTNYCSLTGICGSQTLFDGYCYSSRPTSSWPTIDLYLNGLYISLPPDLYIIEQVSSKDSRIYYCLGISKIPSSIGSLTIIGAAALRGFTVVHDKENDRIGFAIPTSACHAEVVGGINETVFKPVDVMGSLEYIIFGALVVIIIVICICDLCKKRKRNQTHFVQHSVSSASRNNPNVSAGAQPSYVTPSVNGAAYPTATPTGYYGAPANGTNGVYVTQPISTQPVVPGQTTTYPMATPYVPAKL